MQHPADDIDERELARVLAGGWGLAAAGLCYAAVGFGDHHWELTGTSGGRWFITVAGLAGGWRGTGPAEGLADLRAALGTVTALHQAGLDFAVAPVPTRDGQPLAPLGPRHAVAVFPWLDGEAGHFGDPLPADGQLTLITLLACLHNATGVAGASTPVRRPELAGRPAWSPRWVTSASRGWAGRTASPPGACWPAMRPACTAPWPASMG